MKPKNILFRADASSIIGTGHIMRDLVLAEQFKDDRIIFATQDLPGNINHKIAEKAYEIEILDSNFINELDRLIKKYHIDMIVIDHYDIDDSFEKQLKTQNPKLKILSLDDTYEKHYCDILLNHNINADPSKYKNLVPSFCALQCGQNYTLLREEFRTLKQNKRDILTKKNISVFIAMGGADHANKNIEILETLKKFSTIHAQVVTSLANKHLDGLKAYIDAHAHMTLHIDTDKIATLMNEADFAIVTPSVTVNEVIFMHLPFITIQTADNQLEIHRFLKDNGFNALTSFKNETLFEAIKNLLDPKYYRQMLGYIDKVTQQGMAN